MSENWFQRQIRLGLEETNRQTALNESALDWMAGVAENWTVDHIPHLFKMLYGVAIRADDFEYKLGNRTNNRGWYQQYLKSDAWLRKRKAVIKRANGRCQLCNSDEQLNVHHRTYERVTFEELEDLIVLCRNCHARFHEKEVA